MTRRKGHRKYDYKYEAFGKAVRRFREALHWTGYFLAKRVGLNRGNLSRVEQKGESLTPEMRKALCKELADAQPTEDRRQFVFQTLGTLAGLATPLAPPPPDDEENPHLRWSRYMKMADKLTELGAHEQARETYHTAERAATTMGYGVGQALAVASQALSYCDLNNHSQSRARIADALELLGAGDLAPELEPTAEKIKVRLANDDVALRAYARLAEARGRLLQEEAKHTLAKSAFRALINAGIALEDPGVQAKGQHFLGHVLIDEGTAEAKADSPLRRRVTQEGLLLWALDSFQVAAKTHRRLGNEPWLAYDLRGERKVLHMVGKDRSAQATRVQQELDDLLAAHPRLFGLHAQVRLDIGRRTRATDVKLATTIMHETCEAAIVLRSPYLFGEAYSHLAEMYAVSGAEPEAREYAAAALAAWPESVYTRDSRRIDRLFTDLRPTRRELEEAARRPDSPLAKLRDMPHWDQRRLERLLRQLP